MDEGIAYWRARVDSVDGGVLRLVNQRARHAIEIGLLKRKAGLAIEVPQREAAIIERMAELNEGPLGAEAVQRLFEAVIAESRMARRALLEG